jgi:hypothetical protein
VKRLALVALMVLALGAVPAQSATKEYSTGNINVRVGAHLDKSLVVPDRGPVSFVRVAFRITAPDDSALAISLVSPKGTAVPLVTHRGAGADFGSDEKGCGGIATVFESDATTTDRAVTAGKPPFTDNPYRAEGGTCARSTARTRRAAGRCGSTTPAGGRPSTASRSTSRAPSPRGSRPTRAR